MSHNPSVVVGRLNERRDRGQEKPFSYGEEDGVKRFAPPLLAMLITLLANTGIRVKKEALPFCFKPTLRSIQRRPGFVSLIQTVGRESDAYGSLGPAGEALRDWRELLGVDCSPFVFPSPNPQVHDFWYKTASRTAAKKAGLSDRRIYDLRSTFASWANSCRATGITVAPLLGHSITQISRTLHSPTR